MSGGLHGVGTKWLKPGFNKMTLDGFVPLSDLAEYAFDAPVRTGLIEETENKRATLSPSLPLVRR